MSKGYFLYTKSVCINWIFFFFFPVATFKKSINKNVNVCFWLLWSESINHLSCSRTMLNDDDVGGSHSKAMLFTQKLTMPPIPSSAHPFWLGFLLIMMFIQKLRAVKVIGDNVAFIYIHSSIHNLHIVVLHTKPKETQWNSWWRDTFLFWGLITQTREIHKKILCRKA